MSRASIVIVAAMAIAGCTTDVSRPPLSEPDSGTSDAHPQARQPTSDHQRGASSRTAATLEPRSIAPREDASSDPRMDAGRNSPMPDGGGDADGGRADAQPPTEADAGPSCGDGIVSGDEHCDTAIPNGALGACPMECEPVDACTPIKMVGDLCWRRCVEEPITEAVDGDGCCLEGDSFAEDTDCARQCADVTACMDGDGCCPVDCVHPDTGLAGGGAVDPGADTDCPYETCGNGTVDDGETCDPQADPSSVTCPSRDSHCDDHDECTEDRVAGNPACASFCVHEPIDC